MVKGCLTVAALLASAGVAAAQDLPPRGTFTPLGTFVQPGAVVSVPVFSWTGLYAGAHAGYLSAGDSRITTTGNDLTTAAAVFSGARVGSVAFDHDGFAGGGQVGYNFQMGRMVVGLEADASYADLSKTASFTGSATAGGLLATSTFRQELNLLGTIRGRLGYAWDRVLVFGTGGFAYGDSLNSALFFQPQAGGGTAVLGYGGCRCSMQTGFAGGGGVEYALPGNIGPYADSVITVRGEALYYDLGRQNYPVVGVIAATGGTSYTARADLSGFVARAGINFKLGMY